MNQEEVSDITARVRDFLSKTAPSTASTIATAINVSRQKVARIIALDASIQKAPVAGVSHYQLADKRRPACAVESPAPQEALSKAINALVEPMIRQNINENLPGIIQNEVKRAILEIQSRVNSKLSDALRGNAIFETKPKEASAANTTEPAQAVAVGTKHALPNIVPRATTPPAAEALSGPAKTAAPTPPAEFSNPPGDFVPKDILGRRTSHKTNGLPAQKPVSATPPAASDSGRLPKITIVGLHDNKQELIRREFRDKFVLSIFNPDRLRAMQEAIHAGDDVICMANYISHKHTDVVTAAGANAIIVHGGLPSLRDELTERVESRATT